jgi:hypothetical protein
MSPGETRYRRGFERLFLIFRRLPQGVRLHTLPAFAIFGKSQMTATMF